MLHEGLGIKSSGVGLELIITLILAVLFVFLYLMARHQTHGIRKRRSRILKRFRESVDSEPEDDDEQT